MTHNTNYHSVDIDPSKDPKDYHYTERRAALLQAIERNGDPYTINQSQTAKRFDVDQSTISRDLDALADYLETGVIGQRAKTAAWSAFNAALAECDTAKEKFDLVMRWQKWLQSTGEQETAATKIESTYYDGDKSDSYEIIADGDESIEVEGEVVDVAALRTGSADSRQDEGDTSNPDGGASEGDVGASE